MKTTLLSLAATAAVGLSALGGVAMAQSAEEADPAGAQTRIDMSGKLRMLSQRIPSAACHMAANIEADAAQELLAGSVAEFDEILQALEFGNPEFGIAQAEERRKTIDRIHEVQKVWDPFKAAANGLASGDAAEENLQMVLDQNLVVLDAAKSLVSELSEQYNNPMAAVQADTFVIDIAGRQRMLTQKVAKESCIMTSMNPSPEMAEQLKGSMQMFETSLEALRFGMPAVGIKQPPNPGIFEGLGEVLTEWQTARPALDAILAGSDVDPATQAQKFKALNTTMSTMNDVVDMYAEASKHDL